MERLMKMGIYFNLNCAVGGFAARKEGMGACVLCFLEWGKAKVEKTKHTRPHLSFFGGEAAYHTT